jgi:hypothetical protein
VNYTDLALRRFFEEASKQSWFDSTLFIITADHSSYSRKAYFYTPSGKFEVPLMFYSPAMQYPQPDTSFVASHLDILPTVLDVLNYPGTFFSFGTSLLRANEYHCAWHYSEGCYQILKYPYIYRESDHGPSDLIYFPKDSDPDNAIYPADSASMRIKAELRKQIRARRQCFTKRTIEDRYR